MYFSNDSGNVKLAISPTYYYGNYEDFPGFYKLTTVNGSLSKDKVNLLRYKFDNSGDVAFTVSSDTSTDTFLYVIDPQSTSIAKYYTGTNKSADSLYNDDRDEEDPQAQLIKSVKANKDYLVIVSSYDPHTMFGTFSLNTDN